MKQKMVKPRAGDRKGYQCCKRVFDVLFSLIAIVILGPLMLIIAMLVYLQDGGKVLYRQRRLGKGGRPVDILKFRSMVVNAEQMIDQLNEEQKAQYRLEFKIDDDPRVTKLGAFLRKTSLDELPQLFNIIRGEMSLVGPRPVVPEEIANYTPEQRELFHSVLPGLTGYWQACSGPMDSYATGGRQKMELHYAQNACFTFDIVLIVRTIGVVLRKASRKTV